MLVKDIMTKTVDWVSPKLTLVEAARKMKTEDIGALPVGENDRFVGMVTDRDIVVDAIAEGQDPNKTTLRQVLSSPIVWCFDDQTIEDAAHLMESKQIRRLVVLNRNKRLAGILSLGDIATRSQNRTLSGEVLALVSTPPKLAA